ncbi:MAG TPA: 30S ribosomal protein S7 [Candidatus Portnoybacteria bacterium]|uniref:Small ribosomal subunit protein uS7 n=1 Tax=Candidatus Portnoybacteria bacterium CG02_land_8_20_14_3_00_45_8 TaxID=1974807 RepID=A0A2M7D6P2_9BACT|nr:MAG: 30S ribosomal protein S7 [Candidatus Portnoybacteria bacterium CG02_land_8_20_14_3_00_45_8]HCX27633.1 30S ribosomal protein S7 [Candidatus Portnoybacteria bacterium]
MRRKRKYQREILPDPRFQNVVVAKFINRLMSQGKKSVAQKVFYDACDILVKQQQDPLQVFDEAIKNVSPMVEVKSKRIGGANYQVPREVRGDRRLTLAIRWLIGAAQAKKGKPMAEKLAEEFLASAKNEGAAIKKKVDMHRMAEANKAFAHFSR